MTDHLTHIHSNVSQQQVDKTHDGMAFWAGTGPHNTACRECVHFKAGKRYVASSGSHAKGELMPAPCAKGTGKKIPHFASSCKYFEPNPHPPMAIETRT